MTFGGVGWDFIEGDNGADAIFGGAGGDFLVDGLGADTIYGGLRGDTVFLEEDGTSDTVTCGPGQDEVWGATNENTIAGDCEEVHVHGCTECSYAARAGRLESRLSSRGSGLVVRPAALLH